MSTRASFRQSMVRLAGSGLTRLLVLGVVSGPFLASAGACFKDSIGLSACVGQSWGSASCSASGQTWSCADDVTDQECRQHYEASTGQVAGVSYWATCIIKYKQCGFVPGECLPLNTEEFMKFCGHASGSGCPSRGGGGGGFFDVPV